VPSNIRAAQPVTNAVIPATLMTLIGKTSPLSFRGPTLEELLKASPKTPPVLSELSISPYATKKDRPPDSVPTAVSGPMLSIISGNWQLIQHAKYGNQLYDWTGDPAETNDQANSPAGNIRVLPLLSQLQGAMSNSPPSPKSPSVH
jgi:hypothetical protein